VNETDRTIYNFLWSIQRPSAQSENTTIWKRSPTENTYYINMRGVFANKPLTNGLIVRATILPLSCKYADTRVTFRILRPTQFAILWYRYMNYHTMILELGEYLGLVHE